MNLPKSLTSILERMPRIPIEKIRENAVTLRTEYDIESLGELSDSMEGKGQIQPVIVQPGDEDFFDLVIGSRRLRAAKSRGHYDIVAYVIDKREPLELLLLALAENLHRKDLNAFEEAQGFLRLMKEFKLGVKDIAKGVHKPEAYVRHRLQLLSMPDEVLDMVSEHQLAMHHVPTLARLSTGDDQVRFARTAATHHLTQAELSAQVQHELREPARAHQGKYELTPLKVQAQLGEFTKFLQKVPRRMNMRRMNVQEKQGVLKSLQELEDEVRSLQESVRGSSVPVQYTHPNLTRSHTDPSNHGQEWTTKDIRRINSPRRPSDEVLAEELGRTVTAIRAMRAQTATKKER